MFAKSLVVHEEVDERAASGGVMKPFNISVGLEWPFFPVAIREAEGEIIAEAVVFQEELNVFGVCRAINVIRAAPLEDRIPAFSEDAFVTFFVGPLGEIIIVGEFGIAEDFRGDAESFFDLFLVCFDLSLEFFARIKEGEGVIICLGDDFDAASGDETLE